MTAWDVATVLDLERRIGEDQIAQDSSLQKQSQVIIKRKLIFSFRCPSVCLSVCLSIPISIFVLLFFSFPTLPVHWQNEVSPAAVKEFTSFCQCGTVFGLRHPARITLVVVRYDWGNLDASSLVRGALAAFLLNAGRLIGPNIDLLNGLPFTGTTFLI